MTELNNEIMKNLKEWDDLINQLTSDERALDEWKTLYNNRSETIVKETDFKALYGANNQKVRDNHIRTELSDWYNIIKDLEASITYAQRRISYLKELIRTQRTFMELKQ